ncbi:MAG: ABC transporter substrate-binding protein [Gallionella sp.]|nr:ABC transporter substrate-binding protein [Gallionella sp.]
MNTPPDPSRRMFLHVLAALGLLGLGGCTPPRSPLKISGQIWPGFEFMFLARDLGWMDNNEIRLIETTDATDSAQLLAEGLVDGAALTLDEVLRIRASGLPLIVVNIFDFSAGADMLLVRPGIHSLAELRGKRIGVEETALGGLMLSKALQHGHLSIKQVELVHASVDEHESLWQHGKVDALVTYNPVAARLERQGAQRIFDTRAIPNSVVDVLAVTPHALQEHSTAIKKLVDAHHRARAYFKTQPLDAHLHMAARLGTSADHVSDEFEGLRLVDVEENRRLLAATNSPLLQSARDLVATMLQQQLLAREDALDGLFDAGYLPAAGVAP